VAEQTLALLKPMAVKKHVELLLESGEVEADIDVTLIQQALANLVVNGIQAMPSGGHLRVALGCKRLVPPPEIGGVEASFAQLTVSDEGVGIAPDALPRVFEPFFTTKGVGEGTGLGLSVAYGIARDHGGWITASSEVGRGSSFSLFLPLKRPREVQS
jgi:two-component system NtrC family sensor kinase